MTDAAELATAVAEAARRVPASGLACGAAAVEGDACWSPAAAARLAGADPSAGYVRAVGAVGDAWQATPHLPGAAVAAALRAAAEAVRRERAGGRISLVWTGPPTHEITLRSTRAVLNAMVARATESLVLVSYAGYDVDDLVEALLASAARGVEVTLILETKAEGGLTVDAADAFVALRGDARFYRWPLEQRQASYAATARLHAKCAIRDRREALVTSANLTSAAIYDNMELGVLIEAGPEPERLQRHFQLLIDRGTLEPA